jgi:hypothetical protein
MSDFSAPRQSAFSNRRGNVSFALSGRRGKATLPLTEKLLIQVAEDRHFRFPKNNCFWLPMKSDFSTLRKIALLGRRLRAIFPLPQK